MNANLEKELNNLAGADQWEKIISTIEQIPESEWDMNIIGRYVRALNNNCGPEGEPEVVHIEQEADFEITYIAGDFETFVRGLVDEEL